jgi:transcriptional regulator with XRE-family HTH domain
MPILCAMSTRESRAQRGHRRGRELSGTVLRQLRESRLSVGVSQAAMGAGMGWSQQRYSRFESGRIMDVSLSAISLAAALLGIEASVTLHPIGPAIRDAGHEALIRRLVQLLSPAWHMVREAPFPNPGDPRWWDLLLRSSAGFLVGIEAETRIRDLQALVRRMRERGRDGGVDQMVIILSDSAHNRQLVDGLRTALGEGFDSPPRELLRALRRGDPLPGSGVILM